MSRRAQELALYQKRPAINGFERAIVWYIENTFSIVNAHLLSYLPGLMAIFFVALIDIPFSYVLAAALFTGVWFFSLNRSYAMKEHISFIREEPAKSITRVWLEFMRYPLIVNLGCWALLKLLLYINEPPRVL